MPLIFVSLAWIAGIVFGSFLNIPWWLSITGMIPLFFVFFMPKHRNLLVLLGLCIILFVAGGLYFRWSIPSSDEAHLQYYNDKGTFEIHGTIIRAPERTGEAVQLLVSASSINGSDNELDGRVLLIVPRGSSYSTYAYGDTLQIKGELQTPSEINGFDYNRYLANQGIYSIIYSPQIQTIETARGFQPLALVYRLREQLSQSLARTLPEPQASLAQGIILGQRGGIPADIENQFIRTGTAHLLAISGVNLTIRRAYLSALVSRSSAADIKYMPGWLSLPSGFTP